MENSEDSRFVAEITDAQPVLRIYLAKILANSSSTDDVLQEANRVLWQKRDQWDPSTPFLKWAYRVCYFQAKAFLRDRKRDKLVFEEKLIELLASETPRRAELSQLEEALIKCLQKLDLARRQNILRHYEPDVSLATLAHENGLSLNAMSQKLSRTRHNLRRCMESAIPPTSSQS